jgi:hypothetical protein
MLFCCTSPCRRGRVDKECGCDSEILGRRQICGAAGDSATGQDVEE